jgi:peroxiredoxin (alkyl hydroperoxide reductase subunit C)
MQMPMIGQPAPLFTTTAVVDGGDFKTVSLADYKGKWVVLFFYPLDFTFVCPTELTQFRDSIKDFTQAGAVVLGCSIDSEHAHKRWLRDDLGNLGYPLLADTTKRISRDYGVLMEDRGIATRGTFIIDPEQRVQYMGIHNLSVGRDAQEILRVLSGLQSGELCAAGWKKGQAHLKPGK